MKSKACRPHAFNRGRTVSGWGAPCQRVDHGVLRPGLVVAVAALVCLWLVLVLLRRPLLGEMKVGDVDCKEGQADKNR
jgi:hypothetical protein